MVVEEKMPEFVERILVLQGAVERDMTLVTTATDVRIPYNESGEGW